MTMTLETVESVSNSSNLLDYTKSPAPTTPTRTRMSKYVLDSMKPPLSDVSSLTPAASTTKRQLILSPNLPFSPKKNKRVSLDSIAELDKQPDDTVKFQIRKRKQRNPVITRASIVRAPPRPESYDYYYGDACDQLSQASSINHPPLKNDEDEKTGIPEHNVKLSEAEALSLSSALEDELITHETATEPVEITVVVPWDNKPTEVPETPKHSWADNPLRQNQKDLGIRIMMELFNDVEKSSLLFRSADCSSPSTLQSDLVKQAPRRSRSDDVRPRCAKPQDLRSPPKRSASNDEIPMIRSSCLSPQLVETRLSSPRRKKRSPATRKIPLRAKSTDEGLQILRMLVGERETDTDTSGDVMRKPPTRSHSDSRDNREDLRSLLLSPDKSPRRFYFALRKKKHLENADSDNESASSCSVKSTTTKDNSKLKAIQKKLNVLNPFRSSACGEESSSKSISKPECNTDRMTRSIQRIIQGQESTLPTRA